MFCPSESFSRVATSACDLLLNGARQIADGVRSNLQRLHGELLLRLMALRPPWRQRPPEGLPNLHLVSKPNKICSPTTRYYRYFQDNAVCCQKSRALNTLSSNMPINGHWMGKSSNQTLIFHCHVWWSEGKSHFLIWQDCTQHHRYVWELDQDCRNIISSRGYTWPMAWSPRFCPDCRLWEAFAVTKFLKPPAGDDPAGFSGNCPW